MAAAIISKNYFERADFLMLSVKKKLIVFHKEFGCINVVSCTKENVKKYMEMINRTVKKSSFNVFTDALEIGKLYKHAIKK